MADITLPLSTPISLLSTTPGFLRRFLTGVALGAGVLALLFYAA